MSDFRGADVVAALSARRDLGPEYDEAVAERLADQLNDEVARRVAARLRAESAPARPVYSGGQRVLLMIVALVTGVLATAVVTAQSAPALALVVWAVVGGIAVLVNRR